MPSFGPSVASRKATQNSLNPRALSRALYPFFHPAQDSSKCNTQGCTRYQFHFTNPLFGSPYPVVEFFLNICHPNLTPSPSYLPQCGSWTSPALMKFFMETCCCYIMGMVLLHYRQAIMLHYCLSSLQYFPLVFLTSPRLSFVAGCKKHLIPFFKVAQLLSVICFKNLICISSVLTFEFMHHALSKQSKHLHILYTLK